MSLLVALYTVIAFAVTKGIWFFGAYCLVTKTNIVSRIKSIFNDEDEMSEDDIFNMYG